MFGRTGLYNLFSRTENLFSFSQRSIRERKQQKPELSSSYKPLTAHADAPETRPSATPRQQSPGRGNGARKQSTPIRPAAALQPRRQGPSPTKSGSADSAVTIYGGGAQDFYPSAAPARRGLTFILRSSQCHGKRPHFRPHFLHTPRNSREISSAPRDRSCPMPSEAFTTRGGAGRGGRARPQPSRALGCGRLAPARGWPGPVSGSLRRRSPERKCSLGTTSGTARRRSGAESTATCKKERHQYATQWLSGEGAWFARYGRLPPRWASRFPAGAVSSTSLRAGAGACGERPLLSIPRLELTLCPWSSSGLRGTKGTRSCCGGPQE